MAPHGNAPTDARLVTLDGRIIGAMRILAGLLWLANLEWKRPPNFGRDLNNGLYKYVDSAVRLPVFDPFAWIVEHVVLEHYTLFGWYTLTASALCTVLWYLGVGRVETWAAGLATAAVPVSALAVSALWLGETISLVQLLGAGLIVAAITAGTLQGPVTRS